jgi:putative effector of murein hydrolase LrgA (UPF0299 family)
MGYNTDPGRGRTWCASLRNERPLAAFCFCIGAIALLYNLFGNPDVLYDEAAYTWTAKQVVLEGNLALTNQPLFVHPPLMFLLEAGWLRLTGYATAPLPSAIYAARLPAASVGVIDVLLIAAMTYRLTGNANHRQRRVVTGVVTVLTALDPVLVRYDREVACEPFALCMGLVVMHAAWSLRDRETFTYVSAVGLLGGITLLTNEIAIFLVIIPIIFALMEHNGPLIRRSFMAFGVSVVLFLALLLWAAELGLTGQFIWVQTDELQRLIGLIQSTGYNQPGASLIGSLIESVKQYSSSYILLGTGLIALIWCCMRRNTQSGRFLTAWLAASYGLTVYIAAIGTLNEEYFVYPLPGSIVGSVLLADALIARWIRRRARIRSSRRLYSDRRKACRLPLAIGAVAGTTLIGISAASWVVNYGGPGNGVAQVDQYITRNLPGCAMVNGSGDSEKFSYLLGGRNFAYFAVGPAALADGVHYFIITSADVAGREGNMTPALANWIRSNGHEMGVFPSSVYRTVQLWDVPASPYNPVADLTYISNGVFVNTVSSDCGGYTVANEKMGSFYTEYEALGGKGVVGDPISRVMNSGQVGYEQIFDSAVLALRPGRGSRVQALPIVEMLAKDSPTAYRHAGLPLVSPDITTTAEGRHLLTNQDIARLYLGGSDNSAARYSAAVRRYGRPLGPPSALRGGGIGQAFADIVLEAPGNGEPARAATIAPTVLAVGALRIPAGAAATQSPPPLPPGQYGSYDGLVGSIPPVLPSSVKPLILTLGATFMCYGIVIAALAVLRRRVRLRGGQADEACWSDTGS